jgi:hypothetical protein
MKIHGRISEVSGAIDGVDTEFLGFVEAVRQASNSWVNDERLAR